MKAHSSTDPYKKKGDTSLGTTYLVRTSQDKICNFSHLQSTQQRCTSQYPLSTTKGVDNLPRDGE